MIDPGESDWDPGHQQFGAAIMAGPMTITPPPRSARRDIPPVVP